MKKKLILIYVLIFILCLIMGIYFLLISFKIEDDNVINYIENGNIDYKVYLKNNDFYENKYLDKDMLYISSLIDNIKIDFDYSFDIDYSLINDFTYSILGKLIISDNESMNIYFSKDYILKDEDNVKVDDNSIKIKEDIEVDYGYYNNLANNFKMSYGINTNSNLILYFIVSKNLEVASLENNSVMSITIPLTLKSVNIKLNYNELNKNNKITINNNFLVTNISYLIIGIILVFGSIYFVIKIIRLINVNNYKKTYYDKYINRLLKEYDRVIVDVNTKPVFDDKNIINVNSFFELLDARDNLKLPIIYYNILEHSECYFYIMHNNDIYLYRVIALDINRKKKNEKD